jgi:IPT/TIG domain
MRIDSVMPTRVSPGQSVIIQGEGLETATRVFFGEQEVSFDVDGQTLVVPVPDSSGTVELTVEGAEGASNTINIDIIGS